MKFSFSTKGWHDNTFQEFCDIASDLKFDGIELHNIHTRLFTDPDGAFHDYTAAATIRMLFEKKLEIPCLNAICDLAGDGEEAAREISACMDIAANLRIPCVSAKALAAEDTERAFYQVEETLRRMLPEAEERGITLLVETRGLFSTHTDCLPPTGWPPFLPSRICQPES